MLDWQLGAQEIPADIDQQELRDTPEFDALESEIDKLVDIHADSATDWELVSDLASKILAGKGKDLSVAAWLAAAWIQTDNAIGLAAGFHVLRDLHELHWDTMLPPVKRIRGRRNQMDWLLDQIEKSFQEHETDNWSPLTAEQYQGLQADWDFVDSLWQEKDDQAPSFFKLRKYIDALQVESDTADADTLATAPESNNSGASSAEASGSDNSDSDQQDVQAQEPAANQNATSDTTSLSNPESAAALQAAKTTGSSSQPAPTNISATTKPQLIEPIDLPQADNLEDLDAVENYIENGLEAIQKPLPAVGDDLLYAPLMYRFNRQCAWLTIEKLPNANESITAIPAPVPTDVDSLQSLIEANDANAILRFCEAKLSTYRFWLDLNHAAYLAASQNSQAVADVILQETAYFVSRMHGILDLCFNNEQPFANTDTKNWLLNNATTYNAIKSPDTGQEKPANPLPKTAPVNNRVAAALHTEDTIAYATTLAVAGAETRAALNLLEVVANRLQSAADNINRS